MKSPLLVLPMLILGAFPVPAAPSADHGAIWRAASPESALAGNACEGGEIYDDGSTEGGVGWADFVEDGVIVQQFEPSAAATRYYEICICWSRLGADTELEFRLVAFDDDGPGGLPGTRLLDLPVVASAVPFSPGSFYTYQLGPDSVVVPPNAVWIGAQWNPSQELDFSICADHSVTTPQRPIQNSNNGGATWFVSFATSSLLLRAKREVLLFIDGFEAGNTAAWTSTVP